MLAAVSSHADEQDKDAESPATLPASAYPERWCIKTFLIERRKGQLLTASRLAPPGTDLTLSSYWLTPDLASGVPADSESLMNRLREINADSLMTLWSGRSRSLVVGVQKGGYLGVRVAESSDDQ